MLKTRVIPCLLFKERTIVKSLEFKDFRMVGDPTTCARVFNERNADEMAFLDIMASRKNQEPNFKVIEDIAKECFMPLAIGGGIKNMQHIDKLFEIGEDKMILNTALIKNPEFIKEIVKKYGSQAVVISIDAKKINEEGEYTTFILGAQEQTQFTPEQLAKKAQELGAGEILLNSIDNDGKMQGYDLELIKRVSKEITIPLVAVGGAGKLHDCVDSIKAGADAVCAASIFYFEGESIITIKDYMQKQGIQMRVL